MPENKNSQTNSRKEKRKTELENRRLKIKEELEEIIRKTERQNKALNKIIENNRDKA